MTPLPIDRHLGKISDLLDAQTQLILQADPGSGKTTRVPPHLLDAAFTKGKQIWVLEPRRLAAKYSAERVAYERKERVGDSVGYQFRFERVEGPQTRLLFLTEGTFLRRLQRDPSLKNVALVILDEFHERSLSTDIALAYLRKLQAQSRPDLRLLVMSATLDLSRLAAVLEDAQTLRVEAPRFPVTIHYAATARTPDERTGSLRSTLRTALETHSGGILVFLPGMAEIRAAERTCVDLAQKFNAELLVLHGDLPREDQARAIGPNPKRKIVLATNIAETSLTLDGIQIVIDSGAQKQASFSPWSGLPSLSTRNISQASAIQRAGRAGRTAPGTCYRVYSKAEFDSWPAHEAPEILRSDLAQTLLELSALGIPYRDLPWLDVPSHGTLDQANSLLRLLGAWDRSGQITDTGSEMAKLPVSPRIARLLIAASHHGVCRPAIRLAVWLSEARAKNLDAIHEAATADLPRRSLQQLESLVRDRVAAPVDKEAVLTQCVLSAFADRIAKLKGQGEKRELVFANGGSARVDDAPVLHESDFFIVLDAEERRDAKRHGTTLTVRAVVPCAEEALLDLDLTEEERSEWSDRAQRLERVRVLKLGQIVLEETRTLETDPEKASAHAFQAQTGIAIETIDALDTAGRRDLLYRWLGEVPAKDLIVRMRLCFSGADIEGKLIERLKEAARSGILEAEAKFAALAAEDFSVIEAQTPSWLKLPGGRRVRVHYAEGQAPWVESRLQDFFGMTQTPKILRGTLALTVHLLAPNQRAVQVTNDLESFWAKTYPELRNQLMRRYPRHSWPEDPKKATPPQPKPRPR